MVGEEGAFGRGADFLRKGGGGMAARSRAALLGGGIVRCPDVNLVVAVSLSGSVVWKFGALIDSCFFALFCFSLFIP